MAIWLPASNAEKVRLLHWAAARLDTRDFGPAYPIGVARDVDLAAVAVYHQMREANIEMSIAAATPRWATKETISFLLGWPFWQHPQVRRITAVVGRKNKRARRLVEGLGFAREGVCRQLYQHDDGVIYGLTRRFWERSRWHVVPPSQQQKAA